MFDFSKAIEATISLFSTIKIHIFRENVLVTPLILYIKCLSKSMFCEKWISFFEYADLHYFIRNSHSNASLKSNAHKLLNFYSVQ